MKWFRSLPGKCSLVHCDRLWCHRMPTIMKWKFFMEMNPKAISRRTKSSTFLKHKHADFHLLRPFVCVCVRSAVGVRESRTYSVCTISHVLPPVTALRFTFLLHLFVVVPGAKFATVLERICLSRWRRNKFFMKLTRKTFESVPNRNVLDGFWWSWSISRCWRRLREGKLGLC